MIILYRIFTFFIYYLTLPYTMLMILFGSRKWANRLGHLHGHPHEPVKKVDIWLHASSVGEVNVLKVLIDHLKKINPRISIYVTTMTETGYSRAFELFGGIATGFMPLDYGVPVRRFLHTIHPRAAVMIETEIWPNVIMELSRMEIPLFLANGRLSKKAFGRYKFASSAMKRLFGKYKTLMVQSEDDKKRFKELGTDDNSICNFGNLKFDAPAKMLSEKQKAEKRSGLPFHDDNIIFIAGSVRNDEFSKILSVIERLKQAHENIKTIIAPRYPEKTGDLCRALHEKKLRFKLFNPDDNIKEPSPPYDVYIINAMGVLNDMYAISDIAFVGGTLDDTGGHNILEPVWAGIPVLFGLSIDNVKPAAKYIEENNFGLMINDESELIDKLSKFCKGDLSFEKKTDDKTKDSGAMKTAKMILDNISKDAKNLVQNNRQ